MLGMLLDGHHRITIRAPRETILSKDVRTAAARGLYSGQEVQFFWLSMCPPFIINVIESVVSKVTDLGKLNFPMVVRF